MGVGGHSPGVGTIAAPAARGIRTTREARYFMLGRDFLGQNSIQTVVSWMSDAFIGIFCYLVVKDFMHSHG